MQIAIALTIFAIALLKPFELRAAPLDDPPPAEMAEAEKGSAITRFYSDAHWNVFGLPIIKFSPGEGVTYGVLPVITTSGEDGAIKSIIALAGTYNDVTNVGGFGAYYLYPAPDTVFSFFGEMSRFFSRELSARYTHLPKGSGEIIYGGESIYLQYPFERFFGFGPRTNKAAETNFVSERVFGEAFVGFRLTDYFTITGRFTGDRMKLHTQALTSLVDTRTAFATNPEVIPATEVFERLEFAFDTHDHPAFAIRGVSASFAPVISSKALGSDHTFYGYDLRTKFTKGLKEGRFTTIVSGILDQRFGDLIPFYHQPSLGGAETLRAFVERRFTGRHRFSIDIEERIEVARWTLFDTVTALSVDPFVSVGQVFNRLSEVENDALQPVGGIGVRMKAFPTIVGRVDFGFGREGMGIYATLDYPF